MAPDENRREIPDTVTEMLNRMEGVDLEQMEGIGRQFGAIYNGALTETGNEQAAVQMTNTWITAAVMAHSGRNPLDPGE